MSSPIQGLAGGMRMPDLATTSPAAGAVNGGEFQSVFQDAVRRVDEFQKDAGKSMERLMSGESEEVHQTVLAAQRAELSLDFFLQVKNKAVQAYQEIMRMQL
jgi:flagellar hook-basal body complex protein FliE